MTDATVFSYTRCTDLYSSLTYVAIRVPKFVYTSWRFRSGLYGTCMIPKMRMVVQQPK